MELKNYFAQDSEGNILPAAQATVFLAGTSTLASIFKADGSALSNPFSTAGDGLLQFAAENGQYDLRVTAPGRTYTLRIQCNDVAGNILKSEGAADEGAGLLSWLTGGVKKTVGAWIDDILVGLGQRIKQIDTYADVASHTCVEGRTVYVVGRTIAGDGGGGSNWTERVGTVGRPAADGGTILHTSNGWIERDYASEIKPEWWGAGTLADDTPACQSALNLAERLNATPDDVRGDAEVVFTRRYVVSSLTVGRRVHVRFAGGVLIPLDYTTPRTHLVKFIGHNKVTNPTAWMNYATNYDSVWWCRGRYMDFTNPEAWTAKSVWLFGDPAWEGSADDGELGDSEINIKGGGCIWCVQAGRAYGLNTIVYFSGGHELYSFKWTLDAGDPRKAAWEALPEITFDNCGALIYLDGVFTGNFSGQQPNLRSKIQRTNDPAYVNSYGRYILTATHIESGYHFACAPNGAVPIQDTKTTVYSANNCGGYVSGGRAGYLIDGQNCAQAIDIRQSNFYGNVGGNIVYAPFGKVHADADSFSEYTGDFFQTMVAPKHFGYSGYSPLVVAVSSQAFNSTPASFRSSTGEH